MSNAHSGHDGRSERHLGRAGRLGLALALALLLTLGGGLARAQAPSPAESPIISAGGYHTCGLTANGAADCWGRNDSGQAQDQPGPFTAVSAGTDTTCALTLAGAIDCWGNTPTA